ncbi:MAG: hypothetical protein ACOCRO_06470 [Halanaerobiales bacterium]
MNKKGAGVMLCLISSLLFISRYVSAAIFGSGISTWSSDLYNAMVKYVGPDLLYASSVALIIGIIYLLWAELEGKRR